MEGKIEVTRQKSIQHNNKNHRRINSKEDQQRYNEELDEQANMRIIQKENEIKREKQASMEHADKVDSVWGKPGAGAPLNENRRRKFYVDINA